MPFHSLTVITADTKRTANEGYTSGSHSMQDSGTAIQNAAAQVRALLVAEAARRLDRPPEDLRTENGAVIASDGRRFGYGDLVGGEMLHVQAPAKSKLKDPATFKVMGQPVPRVDIPAKVTGGAAYIQDMRLPGMVHSRVVRPPSYGAQLMQCDTSAVEELPGVVKVVRDGNFLAVVASKEFQAIKAMRALSAAAKWQETASLPGKTTCFPCSPACLRRTRQSSNAAIPSQQAARHWRQPIHGRTSRTARSDRPARWHN